MTLIAIIALGVGGFVLAMLALAPIDKASRRAPGAPGRRARPEARAPRAWKPPKPPAWRAVTDASTAWRNGLSADLRSLRAWAARRGIDEREAGWVAATVAFSVVLGYLIAQT